MPSQYSLSRVVMVGCLSLLPGLVRAAPPDDAAGLELFEKKIRPVLVNECYKCHSATSEKLKAGLMLDARDKMLTGGDNGPAIVPGDPKESLLIKAITGDDKELAMPPKKKLSKEVVADFTQWVQMGAPWPHAADVAKPDAKAPSGSERFDTLRRELWSWQPIKPVSPPNVATSNWVKGDTDCFILEKLHEKALAPSPIADKLTLLRRATFDLTGLPPTPAEVDSFLRDSSPSAFEKVVDHLLASPRFGERWGRHWLDVARYAESSGMTRNFFYYYAWRYRDYVIKSFNEDKPYDRFVTEQLAGDLLPYESESQHDQQLIATGFLALGPKDYNERNQRQFLMNNVDEQIDAFGKAMLATTISCARCHDHKFDPIPTAEYYSLAGIFMSTEELPGLDNRRPRQDKYTNEKYLHLAGFKPDEAKDEEGGSMADLMNAQPAERLKKVMELRNRLTRGTTAPPKHVAMGVCDAKFVSDARVLVRGEIDHPGEVVRRGTLTIPCESYQTSISSKESGRLELAHWVTDPSNPLAARVMVNRIWGHLLGVALVKSVDNFGFTGDRPSHPELLDYLAHQFMTTNHWSVKKTIRQIMLSAVYQQASTFDKTKFAADPEDTLLWRQNQRRLEGEAIRDAVLAASGKLDLTPPAASPVLNFPQVPADFVKRFGNVGEQLSSSTRRSVYLPILRNDVPAVLEVFDMADPNVVDGKRDVTTVAPQALFMMNSAFVTAQAKAMVERIAGSSARSDVDRVDMAYRLALGRGSTPAERERALNYIGRTQSESRGREELAKAQMTAWGSFCQALFASAEFRYLN
jgi:hypothetical protein